MWEALGSLLMYGVWAFAMERASKTMPPLMVLVFISLLWLLVDPLQTLVYWKLARSQGEVFHPTRYTFLWGLLVVLSGNTGNALMMLSLKKAPRGLATAVPSAYPLVALLLGVLFAGQVFKASEWVGVVLVVAGVVLLTR